MFVVGILYGITGCVYRNSKEAHSGAIDVISLKNLNEAVAIFIRESYC